MVERRVTDARDRLQVGQHLGRAGGGPGRRRQGAPAPPLPARGRPALLDRAPETGVGQYFYATRRGDFKRSEFHGAALGPDRADVPGLLHSLLEAIRGGDFHPEPGKDKNGKDNKDNCKYCAFDRLCDSSRVKLRERKAEDPRAKAFVELTVSHP